MFPGSLNFSYGQAYKSYAARFKKCFRSLRRTAMVTFLFTSVFVLGLIAIAIYFWQKPAKTSQTIEFPLPPQQQRGLFSDFRVNQLTSPTEDRLPEDVPEVDTAQTDESKAFEEAIEAIRVWEQSPNRSSTAKMLHVAALSDNAKTYGEAIELVLRSWRDGSLTDLSARELQALFNSEYWVLSSKARTSGVGFVLKQTLSNANRELEATDNQL
jgi:hypothetical protein